MGAIRIAFSLASLVGGLFCTRLKTAAIAGAVPALLYATLVIIGLWEILGDADMPSLLGMLTAACLAIFLPAIVGFNLRRGAGWLFRRRETPILTSRAALAEVSCGEQPAEHCLHPFEIERLGQHDRGVNASVRIETAVA